MTSFYSKLTKAWWHLISVRPFGVPYTILLGWQITISDNRQHTKWLSPADCRWPVNLLVRFVWVCMGLDNHFITPKHPGHKTPDQTRGQTGVDSQPGDYRCPFLSSFCQHALLEKITWKCKSISLVWRQKGLSIYLKQQPVSPFDLIFMQQHLVSVRTFTAMKDTELSSTFRSSSQTQGAMGSQSSTFK